MSNWKILKKVCDPQSWMANNGIIFNHFFQLQVQYFAPG